MALPEFSRGYRQGDEIIPLIPSVIHYTSDRRSWIGNQVLVNGLYHSERTFRWMKRYISHRSPIKIRIDDRELSHFDAGKDFLTSILTVAREELSLQDEEIALTVPICTPCNLTGAPTFRPFKAPSK